MSAAGRLDGRTSSQIRPLACEQGLLNRADGSSRFSQGETSVLVAVYGPADVKPNKEIMDRSTVEVIVRPKTGLASHKEKALEKILRQSVDSFILTQLYPRTSLTIVVQIMRDAGSLLSCTINGITMACIDAGLSMSGLLRAITCCVNDEGTLVLDPLTDEESRAKGTLTLAYNSLEPDLIVTSHLEGLLQEAELLRCINVGQKATQSIHAFLKLSIERKLTRQLL